MLLLYIILSAAIVYFTAWLLPGVSVTSFWGAILVALVLGILNTIIKPILQFFSFPITVLTLGLFLLVIDAFIIILADYMLDSLTVDGFWWAVLFSIITSSISSALNTRIN